MKKHDALNEPYTQIPNAVIRSQKLDVYDKSVFNCIASCNPSFPSYEALMNWTGAGRERVWKSLRKLELFKLITRVKVGRSVHYAVWFNRSYNEPIDAVPVRYANLTSSLNELEPVRQANPKKNKEKEQRKSEEIGFQPDREPKTLAEILHMAKEWDGVCPF